MSRARASTTTGSSSRCRRDGETEGVEDGGGWWRLVEVSSAAGRSDLLHRPPPSSTNLQNAVSRCPPRHHHLHSRRRAARFAATRVRAANPLQRQGDRRGQRAGARDGPPRRIVMHNELDRKSTRLNSSHLVISYAVFCLKKKTYD